MFVESAAVDVVLRGGLLSTLAIMWIVVLVRLNGLRSFSKMTNFDFVMTVAVGSLLAGASQATSWPGFVQPCLATGFLFVAQRTASRMRKRSDRIENLIQNEPLLLMRDGQILDDALAHTRVTRSDLFAKLREANVADLADVKAVVLETTGDVSVLHGHPLSEEVLTGANHHAEDSSTRR